MLVTEHHSVLPPPFPLTPTVSPSLPAAGVKPKGTQIRLASHSRHSKSPQDEKGRCGPGLLLASLPGPNNTSYITPQWWKVKETRAPHLPLPTSPQDVTLIHLRSQVAAPGCCYPTVCRFPQVNCSARMGTTPPYCQWRSCMCSAYKG
ncbi:hypothetical protein DPEC_G00027190 [Dallia pectoralis]|uniref:Uncharacterized protein n=1 Tax=Dallia pectoralis TaxID=75939 RepID=A0ACC2HIH3_DALPE|nr:hypothetical protein DPEC_G00027190 [Dallia pectoralis]